MVFRMGVRWSEKKMLATQNAPHKKKLTLAFSYVNINLARVRKQQR